MMYSGDEELSDQGQNPELEDDSDFDHDFEPEEVCMQCQMAPDDCSCDPEDYEDIEQEFDTSGACAICGYGEDDPIHQDQS